MLKNVIKKLFTYKNLEKELSKQKELLTKTKEAYHVNLSIRDKAHLFAEENKLKYCIKVLEELL